MVDNVAWAGVTSWFGGLDVYKYIQRKINMVIQVIYVGCFSKPTALNFILIINTLKSDEKG